MYINRIISDEIRAKLTENKIKIIILYGARQVGKTTLVNKLLQNIKCKKLYLNGDNANDRQVLSIQDYTNLSKLVQGYDILFIDEAQKIEDIGVKLKILHDQCQPLRIIVTGSSALELANNVQESLAGRTYKYQLYPISMLELAKHYDKFKLDRTLEHYLVYGSYPDILVNQSLKEKEIFLLNLTESYLYKDVLEFENIRYSTKIRKLLELLAFQIGSEVSYTEIGQKLGLSYHTVIDYTDLLEKAFVVKTVRGFSRNLRKEINKKPKIYFYDLGIRNALINNFSNISKRNDLGGLWENFLFIERTKRNNYLKHLCKQYFWRIYTGAELDYIEEYNGQLYGYEFKWNKKTKAPQSWINTYKKEQASFQYINKDNYFGFLTDS